MAKVIGIDLGTTNSAVAVMEAGNPKIITNEEGSRTTPSVIGYTKDNERLVGVSARRQAITNPENTIFSIKRFMGMSHQESKKEIKKVPYSVTAGDSDRCNVEVNGNTLTPPEISAQILTKLKRDAERYLGQTITEAVITVPAYFNDAQRQATKDAGKIAGLDVKRIINEPTAAALAYGLDKGESQKVVVYDLGGGTFDVSVLDISDGVVEVLSTNGNTHLGGDDVDQTVMDWLLEQFKAETGIDVTSDNMVLQRVKEAAEKAKIELSTTQQTDINLPFLTADASGPKHLVANLTRSQFENMIESFVKKTMRPVRSALKDAGLKKSDIDEVILVGGSTRIPSVTAAVEKFFGKQANTSVNPDEVVAMGAAVQGGVFAGEVNDILLLDVTPLSLGIETLGGVMTRLIERNKTIPCSATETFSTAADGQTAVDIHVLQGERDFASDNKTLGQFNLDGIPPAPRGMPQIEVKFDIDANGIVSVSAKDKESGKEQSVTITGGSSLSEEEIQEMVDNAKEYEASDKKRREVVENRNKLDTLIYQSQKALNDSGDRLSEATTAGLTSAIETAQEARDSDDLKLITDTHATLEAALLSAGQEVVESIQAEQAENLEETGQTIDSESDGDPIEVDYEDSPRM